MNGWKFVAVKGLFGASMVAGLALSAPAHADVSDDSPDFDCVMMGNHVCGPNNAQGAMPACYDAGGVVWELWPCEAWKPSDGVRTGPVYAI